MPVEVIVNGESVAKTELSADGSIQGVSFDVPIKKSSWVALRIYPSSHTNPVFVSVGGKPIRASQEIGGMVPEIGRPVLVEEGTGDPRAEKEAAKRPTKSLARPTRRSWRKPRTIESVLNRLRADAWGWCATMTGSSAGVGRVAADRETRTFSLTLLVEMRPRPARWCGVGSWLMPGVRVGSWLMLRVVWDLDRLVGVVVLR